MEKFNKILVCLDLTEMDHVLIRYANYLVNTFKPESLIFIHVMEMYDVPDEVMDKFHDPGGDIADILSTELEERIEQELTVKEAVDYSLVLEQGLTMEKIVEYSRKNKIDLTLMGKKIGYTGQGSVARNILGLIPSSVLVVSETTPHQTVKLLVRMDFSKMAYLALQMAKTIAGYTGASVECHHVYKLPLHYFPKQTPENMKKMRKQLGEIVDKEYSKFIRKMKVEDAPPCSYSLGIQAEESRLLYNYAIKNRMDMIFTGTRIKSPLADLILDSTSEKLMGGDINIPVFVVKDRKKSIGFLKAIFD